MSLLKKPAARKKVTPEDLKILERIRQLRLQMLVHSCLYYKYDKPVITDKEFDERGRELAKLQKLYPTHSKKVRYYEAFKDFNGDTGYHLPYDEGRVMNKAIQIWNIDRKYKEKK